MSPNQIVSSISKGMPLGMLRKQASFDRLQDSESKVSNIKQRIFLMQKLIGEDPEQKSVSPTFANEYKPSSIDSNRQEMQMIKAKLLGKRT